MMRVLTTLLVCAWLFHAGRAEAQISDQQLAAARSLADAGLELYEQDDYAAALERFEGAETIFHAPPHLLYIARCHDKLGRLLAARGVYRQLAGETLDEGAPAEFQQAQEHARGELAALEPRIPAITIAVKGRASAKATLDGAPAAVGEAIFVDPGEHRVAAHEAVEVVQLSEGESIRVELVVAPAKKKKQRAVVPDKPEPSLAGPMVLIGLGGAGLVVGAITGALALDRAGQLKEACPDRAACPVAQQPLEDEARALGIASTVGFATGALAGGGLIWLFIALGGDDPDAAEAAVLPVFDGTSFGLRLRF